ncbi:MAG TPA: ABC transporter permease [Terriglobia bacterium]|nr:ABC transporter permease [Terriglobia bacterium]
MKHIWQDLVYGSRMLLKKPGFTIVAALSLALGIGANTVIFSLINTTLLRPLPFADSGKLVVIWTVPLKDRNQRNNINVSSYYAIRDKSQSLESLGALTGSIKNLGAEKDGAPAERIQGWGFSPAVFQALGVKPALGRFYTEEEDQVDNWAPVIVITNRLWKRHFNSDPNVIGKVLTLDQKPVTVIGLLPEDFSFFGDEVDFICPLEIGRTQSQSKQGFILVLGRLKKNIEMKQSQAEIDTIAAQLASSDPERNEGNGAQLQLLQEAAYGGFRGPLLVLQGAVAFVLLIGCANVAGLLLARAASRRTEVAVRTALGAGRGRIVRQLITESFPLSLVGGILGIALSWGGLKLFVAAAPPGFPRLNELTLDMSVLGFTAVVVVLTAVIFGIVPALQASRSDLVSSLKESGRSGTDSVTRQYLRSVLVTAQIALALILLIGAGLMINSFIRVQKNDLGADPRNLLTFDFRFAQTDAIKPYGRYRGLGLWDVSPVPALTFDRILERVRAIPGVLSAAAVSRPPLSSGGIQMPFLIEGKPAPPPSASSDGASQQQGQTANYFSITPNFFGTMKIPVLKGRDFSAQDTASGTLVIIISQTTARRFFANEEPIGKRITLDFVPDERPREIVGVVGDTRTSRFQQEPAPTMYVPHVQQTPRWMGPQWNDRAGMFFVLRTSGDPMTFVETAKHAVADVDLTRPASNFRTIEQNLNQQTQYLRLYILLLGIFGGIAATLAAIGIYGVMSYSVAERTREIGIRMALGANSGDVLKMVMRHALLMLGIGLTIGLAGSFAVTRLIKSGLYGVTATDPATYIGISMLLILVALMASFIPTRRAVRVDPTTALRYE